VTTRSTPLAAILRKTIARDGPIGVATYMTLCLSHPRHGYYASRDPFGASGDFVTAPEISQMFGEALAVWCALSWKQIGAPDPVHIVELGPGRGTLMEDLWRALGAIEPSLAAAAQVHLVETSVVLQAKQRLRLARLPARWHRELGSIPDAPLIVLANEFFDALPLIQLVRSGDKWHERCVDWDERRQRFVFCAGRPIPAALPAAPDGAIRELNPAATAIAQELGARIAQRQGCALIIDYARTGRGDSLAAIAAQRKDADPLAAPGEADLSAHVDFGALLQALRSAGAQSFGPVSQRDLLLALGIDARYAALRAAAGEEQARQLALARSRLIDPDGMGTVFSAIAATSAPSPPPGFG
jgi:NADH dehydrogenase [ubiquinone] 1 alpha subcomplex assembly factor 7